MIEDTTGLSEAITAGRFIASQVLQVSLDGACGAFGGPPAVAGFQADRRRQPWFPLAGGGA